MDAVYHLIKKSLDLSIIRYWNFSSKISNENYKNLLLDVNEKFQSSIKKCLIGKKKLVLIFLVVMIVDNYWATWSVKD